MNPRLARHAAALGKLASPRLGRVFDRERLFDCWTALLAAPALWLAAPPGAGKTTLVATWLRAARGARRCGCSSTTATPTRPPSCSRSCAVGRLAAAPPRLPALRADDLADLPGWLRRRLVHMLPLLPPRWMPGARQPPGAARAVAVAGRVGARAGRVAGRCAVAVRQPRSTAAGLYTARWHGSSWRSSMPRRCASTTPKRARCSRLHGRAESLATPGGRRRAGPRV